MTMFLWNLRPTSVKQAQTERERERHSGSINSNDNDGNSIYYGPSEKQPEVSPYYYI